MSGGLPAVLTRALPPERLSTRRADREAAAGDESSQPRALPDAVAWPLTTDEVARVVEIAAATATPVTARGAGSSLEGNPIPVRGGIVLDLSRMNRVLAVRAADLQVDVQPGVVYAELNRQLRPYGLFFPPSPGGSSDVATIGGMLANNASGIYSARYGATRRHVLAATVVDGRGRVLRLGHRCPKSSAGYDLLGLLVGSEGTLAIATEITLSLAGLPADRRQGGFLFPDEKVAAAVVADLYRFGLELAAVELLDARTVSALNRLRHYGLPERPTLLLEAHGSPAAISEQWEAVSDIAAGAGGEPLELAAPQDAWEMRHHVTRAIQSAAPGAAIVRADLGVPISALPTLIQRCRGAAAARGLGAYTFGHASLGILHVLLPAKDGEEQRAAEAVKDEIVEAAIAAGGTCSGEHGLGTGNRRFAAREHGQALELMRAVKAAFDPVGILNPGKLW